VTSAIRSAARRVRASSYRSAFAASRRRRRSAPRLAVSRKQRAHGEKKNKKKGKQESVPNASRQPLSSADEPRHQPSSGLCCSIPASPCFRDFASSPGCPHRPFAPLLLSPFMVLIQPYVADVEHFADVPAQPESPRRGYPRLAIRTCQLLPGSAVPETSILLHAVAYLTDAVHETTRPGKAVASRLCLSPAFRSPPLGRLSTPFPPLSPFPSPPSSLALLSFPLRIADHCVRIGRSRGPVELRR